MKLFRYEGYNMTISEEALLLKPFQVLWKRDRSQGKQKALMELGYCYFMEDPRSDYQMYIDRDERSKQIKLGEGFSEDWRPDRAVLDAITFYASFKSEAALLAEDTKASIRNLREYLRTIDLKATDDKGKPIYTLNDYTNAVAKVPKLIVELDSAEKAIAREITQNDKVRGSQEKSMYEDIANQ